jgi:hypothetical protein
MEKQISIDWLEMQIVELEKDYAIPHKIYELCEKAKQMHKEEIIESYLVGQEVTALYATTGKSSQTSIQYYNETYGGNNES